ncbi:hypothetical protein EZV73_17000 [Acidaminobacter sp. JC074]|uniref:DUF6470 family protein n=1 Tax=Acidaminobacter sp. JC074 TaxID=2530199 RepID=UPI001F0F59D0|nr:DUF6470 family protein [Acidaminobacter sp. JC074]MCH4889298.1 hypothetical protein [Acidaminobacter sp. JC074]
MALEIRTTPAILGHNITKPQHSIEQPKAQVEGGFTLPTIKVEVSLPTVDIDQNQSFNESGLKDNQSFSADYVAYAKQKMQESIGRIADQGNELTNVHEGGNQIADQALYNAFDQFYNEFGMVTMPRTRPQITLIEGQVDIQVTEGQNNQRVIAQKPRIDYQPGRVERYMEQKNSISIKYIGEKVDLQV